MVEVDSHLFVDGLRVLPSEQVKVGGDDWPVVDSHKPESGLRVPV